MSFVQLWPWVWYSPLSTQASFYPIQPPDPSHSEWIAYGPRNLLSSIRAARPRQVPSPALSGSRLTSGSLLNDLETYPLVLLPHSQPYVLTGLYHSLCHPDLSMVLLCLGYSGNHAFLELDCVWFISVFLESRCRVRCRAEGHSSFECSSEASAPGPQPTQGF